MKHLLIFCLVLALSPTLAFGQPHSLVEKSAPGDCVHMTLKANVVGKLRLTREGKPAEVPIASSSVHDFDEKSLPIANDIRPVVRIYRTASAGDERSRRELRADRRVVVVTRSREGLRAFSPTGPFTRSELEVVAEHFDVSALPNILPAKAVAVGETWKLDPATVQALCLFDGLTSSDMTATLKAVSKGAAIIGIAGRAAGVENGATVAVEVMAEARFDTTQARVVGLTWNQKDVRGQGPVTPASDLTMSLTLTREPLAAEPKELAGVSAEPPAHAGRLEQVDAQGRYALYYGREWHVVGATDRHLVLRLMDHGEFVAQATVIPWKKLAPGQKGDSDEFRKAVAESPGWTPDKTVEAGEVAGVEGHRTYRVTAPGDLEGVKVLQRFYLVTGSAGDQCVVTLTMKPGNEAKLADRDSGLVNGLRFPKAK